LRAMRPLVNEQQVKLRLNTQPGTPAAYADGPAVRRILGNLLSNAVKFTVQGEIVIDIAPIDPEGTAGLGGAGELKGERRGVRVRISDTGPGIREPHRVFDPFYTTKPVGKGTGLGLSICFGIIQEHGGKILCYNRQEGGAVFRVELPAVLAAFPTKDMQLAGTLLNPQKPS